MGFKRMEKMETTEPSVDEVSASGMKKGGKTKMAMGGNAMMANPRITGAVAPALAAQMAAQQGRAALMPPRAVARPAPGVPVVPRKKGGEVESDSEHAKEEREIKSLKSELMSHEDKPASKAHKGLATGGVINGQGGYKKGGLAKYATGGVVKGAPAGYETGGVVNGQGGYKDGGHAKMSCSGGDGYKAMKKGGSF